MIKIKDNITKKQLEEYGFRKNIGGLYHLPIKSDKGDYVTELLLEPLYRHNKRELCLYVNNKHSFEDVDTDIDLLIELDTIYDLIKDEIVEKV